MAAEQEIASHPHTARCPLCGSATDRLTVTHRDDTGVTVTSQSLACSSTSCTWTGALP